MRGRPFFGKPFQIPESVFAPADLISLGLSKLAQMMFDVFAQPLAAGILELPRAELRAAFARNLPAPQQLQAIMDCEPHVPWSQDFLEFRQSVYRAARSPRGEAAGRDLAEYWRHADKTFAEAAQ